MEEEGLRYHRRLAELLAIKKREDYAKTMDGIRVYISFSLIRSASVCLRGSRLIRRKPCNIIDIDTDVQTAEGVSVWGGGGGIQTPICRVLRSRFSHFKEAEK